MYLSLLLSFVLVFSLGDVNGVSLQTNGGVSNRNPSQASAPTQAFPTECGKQFYFPTTSKAPVYSMVGGEEAHANSWPWQVQLGRNRKGICGGTLIDTRHVLTAAHCFVKRPKPRDYQIFVSMHDQLHVYEEEILAVENIWLHEQYNTVTNENDIAIIRLAKPVKISEKINVICLPGPEATKTDEEVWVVGWGDTSYQGKPSRLLQQASLHIMPNGCGKVYKKEKFNKQKQLCAGSHDGKRDACQGDSGGPLMYEKNGAWYLNGVVSYGAECALADYPGVYARVSYYLPWIRSKTGVLPNKKVITPKKTTARPKTTSGNKNKITETQEETVVEETIVEETIIG